MLLVVDAGNTNTRLGVYSGAELVADWRLKTLSVRTSDEYGLQIADLFARARLELTGIEAMAIASVVPALNSTLKQVAETCFHLNPLFVDHLTDTGLPILYQPPSDIGADRIVDALAAVGKYGAPCIVVDFGTATTFNAINKKGEFLGGAIAPGITTSADALFARTAKLPRVDLVRPTQVIGSSTVTAIRSGLYYGHVGLVDGLLQRMIEELGPPAPRVIATGGAAPVVADGSEIIELVDDTLTLDGLRIVLERAP